MLLNREETKTSLPLSSEILPLNSTSRLINYWFKQDLTFWPLLVVRFLEFVAE